MTILLVSPAERRASLVEALGQERVSAYSDPYDALEALAKASPATVIVDAGIDGFGPLLRSVRRLAPSARLIALGPPASEPAMRGRMGEDLDEYYIMPLEADEIDAIRAWAPLGVADQETAGIEPGEIAQLVRATRNVDRLERLVSGLVSQACGGPVRWVDAHADAEGHVLLSTGGDGQRCLLGAVEAGRLAPRVRAYLRNLAGCIEGLFEQARWNESLHRLAITDHLTGAYNRRYFYQVTDQVLGDVADRAARVSLLLYDIDDFKRYNDTYGHAAGDEILRDTARLMRQVTRDHDVVARIGGDEFAVLFRDEAPRVPDSAPPDTARVLAERFLKALREHTFRSLGPEAVGSLTISGGLARYPRDGRTCRDLLTSADAALQRCKNSGKCGVYLVGGAEPHLGPPAERRRPRPASRGGSARTGDGDRSEGLGGTASRDDS
jgi:diguanylate cyclase (GGDEF)-like protein